MARTIDNFSSNVNSTVSEVTGGVDKLNQMMDLVESIKKLNITIPANPFSSIGKIFAEKLPLIIKLLRTIINKLLAKLDICELLNSLPLDEVKKVLDFIINLRNKAVEILTKILQIVTSMLGLTSIIQILVSTFKVLLEVLPLALSAIPYPMPPGIIVNFATFYVKFTAKVKEFESLLAAINGVLVAVAGGLQTIIVVLKSISLEIFQCIDKTAEVQSAQEGPGSDINAIRTSLTNRLSPIPSLDLGPQGDIDGNGSLDSYKGFTFTIKVEKTTNGIEQHYAVALDSRGIEVLEGKPSYASDTTVLISELKLVIDQQNLSGF